MAIRSERESHYSSGMIVRWGEGCDREKKIETGARRRTRRMESRFASHGVVVARRLDRLSKDGQAKGWLEREGARGRRRKGG